MKKMIFAAAISSLLSLTMVAQTPTPPPRVARPNSVPSADDCRGAEGRIAYLNVTQFSQGILELKVKLDALNVEFEPRKKEIRALKEELETLKSKIQAQSNTVSPQVRNQQIEAAGEKEKVLKRKSEDYEALAQKRLGEVYQPVQEKVLKFLANYCQQHGIAMVFESGAGYQTGVLVWYAPAADITDDFMQEYNKANPVASSSQSGTKKN